MEKRNDSAVIAAFTTEQAAVLTGVTTAQLRSWDRSEFFCPSVRVAETGRYSQLYSFRDLLALKVLHQLRNETRVSMDHLREVKRDLSHLGEEMWTKSTLYLLGKRVVIERDDLTRIEAGSGQEVLQIPLRVIVGGMRERIAGLNQRTEEEVGRVARKRGVVQNQAVIAGTRIPVTAIQEYLDAGYEVDKILEEYPRLTQEDVEAARNFDDSAAA